jgi:phage terminase large subunit
MTNIENSLTGWGGLAGSILFKQNYSGTAHITVNQGGTSSGKTYAIEQVLFCLACEAEKQVITIVGQDIPNLKAGALRDALSIYYSSAVIQAMVKSYNKTDRIFEFLNGTAKYLGTNYQSGELISRL